MFSVSEEGKTQVKLFIKLKLLGWLIGADADDRSLAYVFADIAQQT